MARKKYHVILDEAERQRLQELTSKGTLKARQFKRAMILLKADQIMQAVSISRPTVERIRKRFVEGGLERALNEDPRPGQARKLDGRGEAMYRRYHSPHKILERRPGN